MFTSKTKVLEKKVEDLTERLNNFLRSINCKEGNHVWEMDYEMCSFHYSKNFTKPYIRCKYCYDRKPVEVKIEEPITAQS